MHTNLGIKTIDKIVMVEMHLHTNFLTRKKNSKRKYKIWNKIVVNITFTEFSSVIASREKSWTEEAEEKMFNAKWPKWWDDKVFSLMKVWIENIS